MGGGNEGGNRNRNRNRGGMSHQIESNTSSLLGWGVFFSGRFDCIAVDWGLAMVVVFS